MKPKIVTRSKMLSEPSDDTEVLIDAFVMQYDMIAMISDGRRKLIHVMFIESTFKCRRRHHFRYPITPLQYFGGRY